MRLPGMIAAALLELLLASPLQAQRVSDWQVCEDKGSTTLGNHVRSCTAIIKSGGTSVKDMAVAYNNRGNALRDRGDLDRAVADFNAAIRLNPMSADSYINRGIAWYRSGNLDRAIADYGEAIRLDPNDAYAYNDRALALRAKGDLDAAIADHDHALRLDPKEASLYTNRGLAWQDKGDLDRAIADFDEALRHNSSDALAYNKRALAWQAKGDFVHAIADFDEAIRVDPQYAGAYGNRARAWEKAGDFARAIADCDALIRLDPKSAVVYFQRGRLLLYSGALPAALTDLNMANELKPDDAYVALWLDIAGRRNRLTNRLVDATRQIDMTRWPAPILQLYLDLSTPEAVLAAADNPDPQTRARQVCEANFYDGEFALQRGARDEAARLLRLAAAHCPKTLTESIAANVELKTLIERW
jgi:tetratricopeptide (TPR) repeat protein